MRRSCGSAPTTSQISERNASGASMAACSGLRGPVRRFQASRSKSWQRLTVTRSSHAFKWSSLANAVVSLSRRRNTSWYTSSASAGEPVCESATQYTELPQRSMACCKNSFERKAVDPSPLSSASRFGTRIRAPPFSIIRAKFRSCSRKDANCGKVKLFVGVKGRVGGAKEALSVPSGPLGADAFDIQKRKSFLGRCFCFKRAFVHDHI